MTPVAFSPDERRTDEFLAVLAHELKTPLVPLRHALQLLELSRHDPQAVDQARSIMLRQVESLVRLTDELRDFRRISSGQVDLRCERVELAGLVRRAVEDAWPVVEAAGHGFIVSLPHEPIWLEADVMRLSQVVTHLLNNAVRYTPRGGRVEVVAAREEGRAVIRVRDSGIGIPAAMLPRVFDLFVRVERRRKVPRAGLGIGLSVSRWMVELHGGTIEARSAGTDQGSEFVLTLPLARSPARAPMTQDALAAIPV